MASIDAVKTFLENANDEIDNLEIPELSTIHGSTIDWHEERENINFTDREIMHTLDKLFYNGKTAQEILSHLEQLL